MLDLTSDKTMLNVKHPDPLMEPQQKIKGPPLSNFSKVWSQAAAGWHGSIRVLQHCPVSERLRGKKENDPKNMYYISLDHLLMSK